MNFLVECNPPKFLDYSGVCSSCPIQTYPSALIKTLFFSKDSAKRCLTCNLANNIGLFCFGDDIYTPRINYWQPKFGNFIYFRCPFEGNCRGDERIESNELSHDEKYSTRFCEKNIGEPYSAGDFASEAVRRIQKIHEQGKRAVIAGGCVIRRTTRSIEEMAVSHNIG